MQIRFYTIFGKFEDYENFLRNLITKLRNEVSKLGKDPERINLTLIKIKPEAVEEVLKYVQDLELKPPEHLKYLINNLRIDNVRELPALIINGRKIFEGTPISMDELEKIIIDEVNKEFKIEIGKEEKKVETVPKIEKVEEIEEFKPRIREEIEHREITKSTTLPSFRITLGKPNNCLECIYYGVNTKYCFLLGKTVDDPSRPICKYESL